MLLVFPIAMVLYPEAQAKAQADIDRVDRLPTTDDRPDLPCVDNIVHEIARFVMLLFTASSLHLIDAELRHKDGIRSYL